jgi:hypothetical protein
MNDAAEASMERRTARATLITDIENRLQFNTFVSIFFGTLLYSFSRSLDKPDAAASKLLLHSASLSVLYLMSYCFFHGGRSLIPEWWRKRIGEFLLLNAALFVLPTGIIAAIDAKWSRIEFLFGVYSFPLISLMTALLLLVMMGGTVAGVWRRWLE